jgi:hypothetical protein
MHSWRREYLQELQGQVVLRQTAKAGMRMTGAATQKQKAIFITNSQGTCLRCAETWAFGQMYFFDLITLCVSRAPCASNIQPTTVILDV